MDNLVYISTDEQVQVIGYDKLELWNEDGDEIVLTDIKFDKELKEKIDN